MADLLDQLTRRLSLLAGVDQGESMFGNGVACWVNGKEVAHFEAPGMIEVRLTKAVIRELRSSLKSDSRVVFRPSGADWLTVHFATTADVDFIVELVSEAEQAHRPPPGVTSKPPPTGADLERRKRFH